MLNHRIDSYSGNIKQTKAKGKPAEQKKVCSNFLTSQCKSQQLISCTIWRLTSLPRQKTITEFSLLPVGFEDLLHSVCPHDCLQAKAVVAGAFFQRLKPVKD